jgi:hypothetical protein
MFLLNSIVVKRDLSVEMCKSLPNPCDVLLLFHVCGCYVHAKNTGDRTKTQATMLLIDLYTSSCPPTFCDSGVVYVCMPSPSKNSMHCQSSHAAARFATNAIYNQKYFIEIRPTNRTSFYFRE